MDLGQDRRGVDMGPSAIRYARLEDALSDLGYTVTDLGNAGVPIPEMVASRQEARHLDAVRSVCDEVARRAEAVAKQGDDPAAGGAEAIPTDDAPAG